MNTNAMLILARKHLGGHMEASARFCMAQAVASRDAGNYDAARMWALRSLKYSIGILHADYARASK